MIQIHKKTTHKKKEAVGRLQFQRILNYTPPNY